MSHSSYRASQIARDYAAIRDFPQKRQAMVYPEEDEPSIDGDRNAVPGDPHGIKGGIDMLPLGPPEKG